MVSRRMGNLLIAAALSLAVVVAVEIMLLTSPVRAQQHAETEAAQETPQVLQTETAAGETPVPEEDIYPLTMYTTTLVNMRTAPSVESDIYRIAETYSEVIVTGIENGWASVSENGTVCYVSAEYLREKTGGPLIVIDPGHQMYGDSSLEPIGPGADETAQKMTSGASGGSGVNEFEITMTYAEALCGELASRGFDVILTRTASDVNMSNSERAKMAETLNAAVFICLHAETEEDSTVSGVRTVCMTASNPFNADIYTKSRELAYDILGALAEAGCTELPITETDSLSEINWSSVPVTFVMLGCLSNETDVERLEDAGYRTAVVSGIADGIEIYFAG